jgi:hypothetical protein
MSATAAATEQQPPAQPTRQPLPAPPKGAEPIPVRELHFCVTTGRDLPLASPGGNSWRILRAGPLRVGSREGGPSSSVVEIQYEPWHRHHRVRVTTEPADEGAERELSLEFCIPESWVTYVPEPV